MAISDRSSSTRSLRTPVAGDLLAEKLFQILRCQVAVGLMATSASGISCHSSWGTLITDHLVERPHRDVRITRIYEGIDEIQKEIVDKRVLGQQSSRRPQQ